MNEKKIFQLVELATEAQLEIQKIFKDIDPVIGLVQSMRDSGFPVDALTIDSIVSRKRIILLLHDDKPEELTYQFTYMDKDPGEEFISVEYKDVTADQIYEWIKEYFPNG